MLIFAGCETEQCNIVCNPRCDLGIHLVCDQIPAWGGGSALVCWLSIFPGRSAPAYILQDTKDQSEFFITGTSSHHSSGRTAFRFQLLAGICGGAGADERIDGCFVLRDNVFEHTLFPHLPSEEIYDQSFHWWYNGRCWNIPDLLPGIERPVI